MDKHKSNDIFTIVVGGAAGDGVREAATNISQALASSGFEVFMSFKYPSLIRGGHNFARISFSKEKITSDHTHIDVLIALNEDAIKHHRPNLEKDSVIFAETFDQDDMKMLGENAVTLALTNLAAEAGAPAIARSSVALGGLCYLLDIPLPEMTTVLERVFKEKSMQFNVALAKTGYEKLQKLAFRHYRRPPVDNKGSKTLLDGNTAFALGLRAAGLQMYIAYPMTPSTGILHYLAKQQEEFGIKVIQPENEIAGINMALGASYTGTRVAVGTATGGFALMQEAFSLAGITELPLVVAVSQRMGPATGVPTHSGQTDLRFVIHAGHGEFPHIVIAPGGPEEAFRAGHEAMNLAWKYQMPVIVLLDKHVSENLVTSVIDSSSVVIEKGNLFDGNGPYKRYAITDDGVSPLAFPGTPGATVKVNSYEHDEEGIVTEEADAVQKMQDKRFRKQATLASEMEKFKTVKIYGSKTAKTAILCWGSTKMVLLEAMKFIKKPVRIVQVIWMEPFDIKGIATTLKGVTRIIDVESNHNAQLAGLVREKTGIEVTDKILRYDGKPFTPVELADEINLLLK